MFKPLSSWIKRTHPLPARFYTPGFEDTPKSEWATWLSIEEFSPLYLAPKMKWLGLKESREKTSNYLDAASELIDGLEGAWLDSEERMLILEELGKPPLPSLPIYLISCSNGVTEEVVYIGKTENKSRFAGGHSAALKLHAPEFEGNEKNIYRSTVWFHDNEEYISLDWVQPESLAISLLDSVESQLIYHFQPVLNINKKKKVYAKWNFRIHVQNFLESDFLNDTFI